MLVVKIDPFRQQIIYMVISDLVALIPSCAILFASPGLRNVVLPDGLYDKIWYIYTRLPLPSMSTVTSMSPLVSPRTEPSPINPSTQQKYDNGSPAVSVVELTQRHRQPEQTIMNI